MTLSQPQSTPGATAISNTSCSVQEALLLLNLRNGALKELRNYTSHQATHSPLSTHSNSSSSPTPKQEHKSQPKQKRKSPVKSSKKKSSPSKNSSLLSVNTANLNMLPLAASHSPASMSPNVTMRLHELNDPPAGAHPPLNICAKPARAADSKYINALHIPSTLNTAPYKYRVRFNIPPDIFRQREILFRVRRSDTNEIVLFNNRPKKRKRSKTNSDSNKTEDDRQPAIKWHLHDFQPIEGGFQVTYQITFSLCSFHFNKSAFYIELWSRSSEKKSTTAKHDTSAPIAQQIAQGDRTEEDKSTHYLELLFRFPPVELLARKRKEQDVWQEREGSQDNAAPGEAPQIGEPTNPETDEEDGQRNVQANSLQNSSSDSDDASQPLKKRRRTA